MPFDSEGFGERLRLARIRKDMCRSDVAESVGFTKRTLDNWEGGKVSSSIESLANLSELYGVSVDWLLGNG